MEEKNQVLVQQLFDSNPRFRRLYEEHALLEKEMNELDQKRHLSPEEEVARKKMQKLKLAGKDEMERIMRAHRQ